MKRSLLSIKTNRRIGSLSGRVLLLPLLLLWMWALPLTGSAQGKGIVLNLAAVDGVALSPDNLFAYSIQSGLAGTVHASITGTLRYRQSGLSFSYTFTTVLRSGMNMLDGSSIHPSWTFSNGAFRELFMDYRKLPEGTYEYCVSVAPLNAAGEHEADGESSECLYGKSEDIFLINLVSPENNAKLYEHHPVFSWIVNYPFASQLTYRIRVAEVKQGQNVVGAVSRNNPVYQESNLPQTTTTYPAYGEELKTFQPYGWTVDAYYKGILLGGAEPWKFTIIEDSEMLAVPKEISYLDLRKEKGGNEVYAIGKLKLKYTLEDARADTLFLELARDGNVITMPGSKLTARHGDNRYEIDFSEEPQLRHLAHYTLTIRNTLGERFAVLFRYINPEFLSK